MVQASAATPSRHRTIPPAASSWDRGVRRCVGALLAGLSATVLSWWAAGGGIRELAAWPSVLVSVGHAAALLGSLLLLAQVVLMSRLPLLERAFGQDRLTRLHRVVGTTSFGLVLVHVGAAIWAHAGGDPAGIVSTGWSLTTAAPGMLLAAVGTVFLTIAALTSIGPVRRALRYESWHLLHLYAYLGIGLAVPHQLWTGREFLASPARTAFWWTLWGVAALCLVVWRVVVPLRRSWRAGLRVACVVPEGDGCVSVHLTGPGVGDLGARAGHWFTWRFLTGTGWTRAHPYSLSAAPDGRSLRITVKDRGDGSAAVAGLRVGTRVLVEGPYGRLTARARERRKVALIGAGVGMTPIRALAEEVARDGGDAVVLHRFTGPPLFADEFADLARHHAVSVVPLPGRRRSPDSWFGEGVGVSDDLATLRVRVPDIAQREVYLCGAQPWTRLVERTLRAAGVPSRLIHTEAFSW